MSVVQLHIVLLTLAWRAFWKTVEDFPLETHATRLHVARFVHERYNGSFVPPGTGVYELAVNSNHCHSEPTQAGLHPDTPLRKGIL